MALVDLMNVALIAPRSVPYPGALERHVRELARGLVRRGVAVELLTQGSEPGMRSVSEVDGVRQRRFSAPRHGAPFPVAPALSEYLRRSADSFDLVHVHCTHPLLALAAARARPGRLVFSPLAPMERMLRWPYGGATRAAVYVATATICMSRSDAALLCRTLPMAANRVRVVPEGVDMGAIRGASPFPTVSTLVLTVGRLLRHKRVDRAIAAMAGLVPAFELVVVGDGPARRRLKAYAADLQVSSRVRFAGRASEADLHRWLNTARLVVTLSEEEAFGIQVLEGIAAGRPVVASDIPAHRELGDYVADGAVTFVSPEGSPLDVADAIRAALAVPVPDLIRPLPSWDDVVDTTLALYEELLPRAPTNGAGPTRPGRPGRFERGDRPGVGIEG
jgi:glycosyltransferase involved in cell wall biosynthesis